MRSFVLGRSTSRTEVQDISRHGVWLYAKGREFLLPFENFPWFKDAKVSAIYNVKLVHQSHLYWPELDVDLAIESLEHTDRFPLVAKKNA